MFSFSRKNDYSEVVLNDALRLIEAGVLVVPNKSCALKGRGPWPKVNIQNKCPWCGKMNCCETAR